MKERLFVLIIVLVSVGVIIICFLQRFLEDPLWASVFVTIVLVGINIYYAWQARQTTGEMEKARKADFMPVVKTELTFLGPMFLLLRFTNVGKGPAVDIKATVTFSPSNETRPWRQRIMAPDDSFRVLLPDGRLEKVCEKATQINVKGEYTDIFGQPFEIDEEIDAKEFIEESRQLQPILETDLPQLLRDIKEEMRRLKDEVGDIRRALQNWVRAKS